MNISTTLAPALAGLFLFGALAHGADNREPLHVMLKAPVAKGAVSTPTTGSPVRSLGVRVEDGRGESAGAVIGRATSDDDVLFPIIASNEVTPFVEGIVTRSLSVWGIDSATAKDGLLRLRYAQFDINEKNRAVGATYVAEVRFDWTLLNRAGREVSHGSVYGTTDHYGHGRSAENINETLADAIKGALAQLANEPGFRKLWSDSFQNDGVASAPRANAPAPAASGGKRARPVGKADPSTRSIEMRLRKLDELYERKAITKEEYEKRRAAILDEV